MIGNKSLRFKIFMVLTPMFLALTIISFDLIYKNYEKWQRSKEFLQGMKYIRLNSMLIHEMQKERTIALKFLVKKANEEAVGESRKKTNEALDNLKKIEATIPELILDSYKMALDEFQTLRKTIDSKGDESEIIMGFSSVIDSLIRTEIDVRDSYPLDGIENRILGTSIFDSAKENMGKLGSSMLQILIQNKSIPQQSISDLETFKTSITLNLSSQALDLSGKSRGDINGMYSAESWKFVLSSYQTLVAKSTTGDYGVDPDTFVKNIATSMDELYRIMFYELELLEKQVDFVSGQSLKDFFFHLTISIVGQLIITFFALRVVKGITTTMNSLSDDIRKGASSLTTASNDLSLSSNKLSSGVTEQAAAIQETVTSLDEVRAMVEKNADNATMAKSSADVCVIEAKNGQDTVKEMVKSIHEIEESTLRVHHQIEKSNEQLSEIVKVIKEINGKTKVINDIVFQTKLLSFNASVEAARAGEHGRGFAVVAEEVGNLAQMSGTAAKDIATLLENSVHRVESIVEHSRKSAGELIEYSKVKVQTGKESANNCDQVLMRLITSFDSMAKLISDISIASQEQALGVNEISGAMNQLSKATEENNTAAAQSASSAQKVNDQSKKLDKVSQVLFGIVYGSRAIASSKFTSKLQSVLNFSSHQNKKKMVDAKSNQVTKKAG